MKYKPAFIESHPLRWLIYPLAERADAVFKPMFGGVAVYLSGKMVLCLAVERKGPPAEPWNGLLLPVERAQHEAIRSDYPELEPHEILPKWLYLSQSCERFENLAAELVERVAEGDPRFGVVPKPRKARKKTAKKKPGPS